MPIRPCTSFQVSARRRPSKLAAIAPRLHSQLTRKERGYDEDWLRLRDRYAKAHPLCEHCRKRGIIRRMAHVDHIIDIADRPDLRLDEDNLQSLCAICHGRKTRAKQNQPTVGAKIMSDMKGKSAPQAPRNQSVPTAPTNQVKPAKPQKSTGTGGRPGRGVSK